MRVFKIIKQYLARRFNYVKRVGKEDVSVKMHNFIVNIQEFLELYLSDKYKFFNRSNN